MSDDPIKQIYEEFLVELNKLRPLLVKNVDVQECDSEIERVENWLKVLNAREKEE